MRDLSVSPSSSSTRSFRGRRPSSLSSLLSSSSGRTTVVATWTILASVASCRSPTPRPHASPAFASAPLGGRRTPPPSTSTSPGRRSRRRRVVDSTSELMGWRFTPESVAPALANAASDSVSAASNAALETASATALAATGTVYRTVYKAPFLSLCLAFVMGGIFFSAVAAAFAAAYAFGRENTRRLRVAAGILVRRVSVETRRTLVLANDVLLGREKLEEFKNRFPAALNILREGLAEIRRVYAEGVDAIQKEVNMYSAAVGLPGLIPIQYIFDRIVPLTLTAPFRGALEDALANVAKENADIRQLSLKKFDMGDAAPRITEARLFDLGPKDMAFDLDVDWRSTIAVDLSIHFKALGRTKLPASLRNVRFKGPVRIVVVGLMTKEPGYQALLISLPRAPKIQFDLRVAGGAVTEIPFLRRELARILDEAVEKEMLWPRRAVVSAPSPYKAKPFLNPEQFLSLMRDDPLLRRERELMASIPDDFKPGLSGDNPSSGDGGSDERSGVEISDANGNGGESDGGEDGDGSSEGRLWKLWKRKSPTTETATALEQIVESLRQENIAGVARPVVIFEGAPRERSLVGRVMHNMLLPRTIVSYAVREA